ncbi:MAG: bifunctional diaminohydroxyphosphoribosylaminopyrimidine deaminase/5-amino-6-(5-phosphoribosylamino)uracil reductase RibD [Bacteroidota bacterium]
MKVNDLLFLDRCCDLARLGGAAVSPNPRVGAVLVYQGRIIGEGFHQQAGGAHAEVECVRSVQQEDRPLIPKATLYVSLEPCCFHGRTPACTSLIQEQGIKEVVIGQIDQTAEVSGKGISILTSAGVNVRSYPAHKGCQQVARERQVFATEKRPFVQLKYAQSADGFLAPLENTTYWISSPQSRILTHRWRSRSGAILVGAKTVIQDNPQLNSRLYPGPDPLRIVVDPKGQCSGKELVFQEQSSNAPTLWLRPDAAIESTADQLEIIDLSKRLPSNEYWGKGLLKFLFAILHQRELHQLTVEGGAAILRLFLEAGQWDEILRFTNPQKYFGAGVEAPSLTRLSGTQPDGQHIRGAVTAPEVQKIGGDILEVFYPRS